VDARNRDQEAGLIPIYLFPIRRGEPPEDDGCRTALPGSGRWRRTFVPRSPARAGSGDGETIINWDHRTRWVDETPVTEMLDLTRSRALLRYPKWRTPAIENFDLEGFAPAPDREPERI
jgi:hypothetical protein